MEKEFIPYSEALALKELGFDEPCFTKFENYFNRTKLEPIIATLALNSPYENEYNGYDQKIINDNTRRWFFTGYKNSIKDHNQNILSAPLYQQAFRWFKEKYKLMSCITPCSDGEYIFTLYDLNKCDLEVFVEDIEIMESEDSYEFFEDAELEGLKKLIEIVKNK